jgi:hypothetical protein
MSGTKVVERGVMHLTSSDIRLANLNNRYDPIPLIAQQSPSNFALLEEPSSKLLRASKNL